MKWILEYIVAVNIVTFIVWAIDKVQARRSGQRIAEQTLFGLAFLGGSVGAWAAMYLFRHKTLSSKFRYGIPAILFMEAIFAVWLYFKFVV